ncbi:NAD-dependent epimerase/dehydratase family protein [Demequina sp.]|uniref:NAD-dependent epimerase/dehydratase family protein n=1 Tax=Demequina sp. TaxID=2050685 RepID=UPI003D0F05C6
MSTVYDVAVVGSRGFLGSAVATELERRGAHVGRFTKDHPFTGGAATVVWAAGHVTPADTTRADQAIGDLASALNAARRSGRVPHVVLLSSGGAVYGPPAIAPFRETDEPSPANDYGRVKLAEERLLADQGVPHTVLRISNPYGPAQVSSAGRAVGGQGVVGHWLAAIRTGQPITLFGDGSAVRDYVYVDDVADAIATATERRHEGLINVGSGVGTSLAQLLGVVQKTVAPHPVEVRSEPARGVDPVAAWLGVDRAAQHLGWRATTSLEDGLARTWDAVRP